MFWQWKGMGSQELLDYFSSYAALKARHSYGPQGHRGMSALIFEGSAAGYLEGLRLHNHFREQGRDRKAWDCSRVTFCPGAKHQLYGFMALKEDLAIFNQHSKGLFFPLSLLCLHLCVDDGWFSGWSVWQTCILGVCLCSPAPTQYYCTILYV